MPRETVLIGCRLPNGIILTHPKNQEMIVRIAGTQVKSANGLYIPPKPYETTKVDAEFWNDWKAAYAGFPPLKNRALFEAKSDGDIVAKAKEVERVRTGFEQMPTEPVIDGVKLTKADS